MMTHQPRQLSGSPRRKHLAPMAATALSLVAMLALTGPALAQAGADVRVSFAADARELTVGDPVTLTLEVTHPANLQVILPRVPGTWGPFEVRSQSPVETTRHEGGTETVSQTLVVTLFSPGTFVTPELSVTVRDAGGTVSEKAAPPVLLKVRSVVREGDEELRDIKSQADLVAPRVWPWIIAGLALAGLLGAAAYLLLRRKDAVQPEAALPVDTRSADRIALDELDRIEALDLPTQGHMKDHYTLVSDCLRLYLEGGHQVSAIDHTTEEVRLALKRNRIERRHSNEIVGLLAGCDLVKFAKHVPEFDVARLAVEETRRLVNVTWSRLEPTVDVHTSEPAAAVRS